MMSLWDALRMNMMISYQELVRTFLSCDVTYIGVDTFRVTLRNTLSGAGISSSFAFSITRLL
ncbi:hypothetical protein EIZ89_20400 [Escherichia coli]|nr:hypothetical protein [Escherichia coli]